jgi:hypothetical protein
MGMGTYTNPATVASVNVALTDTPDYFRVRDITLWGAGSTAVPELESEWYYLMPNGSYLQTGMISGTSGTSNYLVTNQGTSGGFTFIDQTNPPVFAGLAATAINHTTGVVSMTNTGSIAVGDIVRVVDPVAMLQIGGLTFTVTAVTANTSITLGYNGVAMGTANATSATIVKIYPSQFVPKARIITNISTATQAVVTFATTHGYVLGQEITLHVPNGYGMTQINGQKGTIQAINTTNNTVTLNINSSGYTAFAYPTSANIQSSGQNSPAIATPAGSGVVPNQSPPGTTLLDAFDNKSQFLMNIGLSVVGAASSQMVWEAYKYDFNNGINNQ